jgi:hypothetical protein
MKPRFPQFSKNKMSKINAADLLCWLSGQASVGFLPLAENKLSDFGFDRVFPVPLAHREPTTL